MPHPGSPRADAGASAAAPAKLPHVCEVSILSDLYLKSGALTAGKYGNLFQRLYDHLAANPEGGPRRPRLGRGIRIGVVWPFVVIFRPDRRDDIVEILRIVHGRRRMSRRLLNE